jgi:hypothetical protein
MQCMGVMQGNLCWTKNDKSCAKPNKGRNKKSHPLFREWPFLGGAKEEPIQAHLQIPARNRTGRYSCHLPPTERRTERE